MMPAIARTRNGFDHATCKSRSAPPANSGSLELRDRFPDVEVIVGALTLTPPAPHTLHRTASNNILLHPATCTRGKRPGQPHGCAGLWSPGVGGSSPLTHPKIDRLLTCTGALYKIHSDTEMSLPRVAAGGTSSSSQAWVERHGDGTASTAAADTDRSVHPLTPWRSSARDLRRDMSKSIDAHVR
jgi:hypothetical protein